MMDPPLHFDTCSYTKRFFPSPVPAVRISPPPLGTPPTPGRKKMRRVNACLSTLARPCRDLHVRRNEVCADGGWWRVLHRSSDICSFCWFVCKRGILTESLSMFWTDGRIQTSRSAVCVPVRCDKGSGFGLPDSEVAATGKWAFASCQCRVRR